MTQCTRAVLYLHCYGIALHYFETAGNFQYLGAGIGNVFVLLGRRILEWKPGVFQGEKSQVRGFQCSIVL